MNRQVAITVALFTTWWLISLVRLIEFLRVDQLGYAFTACNACAAR